MRPRRLPCATVTYVYLEAVHFFLVAVELVVCAVILLAKTLRWLAYNVGGDLAVVGLLLLCLGPFWLSYWSR